MERSSSKLSPFVVAILVFLLDVPIGSAHVPDSEEITLDTSIGEISPIIPPLICGEKMCNKDWFLEHTPIDSSPPSMEFGWWNDFWSDSDSNGFDDRLQLIVADERESVSVTSIIGSDGRPTVAIIVHYAWHPGPSDIESLKMAIEGHGWGPEGSWFMVMDHLDAIVLDHVPVISLIDIWQLNGVVLVEEQSVIVPYLDKATKGSKVRTSGVYDETLRGLGYHGSGKVIAILDTGVDNEHFSLDDFSDNNKDNTNDPDDIEDPKWVGGCDSTGVGQSGCNDEDPDDGDGHGTHVAGIALGTGDSSRVNQGYSPGSYLVDVKVMEDYGGGNSQSILAGLQWVINNRDTDWGNNASSRGIDVVSMSFGRASSAVGDSNEDGTSAEANLVNQASENGLVCIAAIGNDGANNVNSVGAADTSITVGWLDDKNTIDRDDDAISSNSNYGPRTDDGDGDSWDEMKPWVVAPGSNINSAQHAESSGIIPGSEVNRASDDYTQLSGSSMSTPAVAGMVAIMLEIGDMRKMPFMDEEEPGIERYEAIRSFLASGSEFRSEWSIDDTFQDNGWNTRYGFGIIDGGKVASEMFDIGGGGGGGGGNETSGPGANQEGKWVEIESPAEFSWLVEGQEYNLRGHINEHGDDNGTIEEVVVRVEMEFRESSDTPKQRVVITNWSNPTGIINWTSPFQVPDLPEDYTDVSITGMAAARNDIGRWSNTTEFFFPVGRVNITMEGPSGQDPLEGSVEVHGQFQSIGNATIQWRLDNEEWQDGPDYHDGEWTEEDLQGLCHSTSQFKGDGSSDPCYQGHAYCVHMFREGESSNSGLRCKDGDNGWTRWSFNWDTTQYKDDEYRISVRVVSAVGVVSEEIRRVVTVDNIDPMPDLLFVSKSISIQEFGIPMQESYVNTFLEVRATIRNTGDQAATDVGIILEEWGERRDEYVIPNIDSGQFVEVVLYWNPTDSGDALLTISIDPLNSIQELDNSNNELSGTFSVLPRPPGVDLAIRAGAISAVTVSSPIPRPDESVVVQARVDNLGSQDAVDVSGTLEMMIPGRGWEMVANSTMPLVLGGSHSLISFPIVPNSTGPLEVRISVLMESGSDNDWSDNVREKTLLVDSTTLTGPRDVEMNPGESPIAVVSLDSEEGDDLLIGEKEGTLLMYKLSQSKSLVECNNVIEERWSGDISVVSTEDGYAHIVWTRRYMGPNWFLMQTLSYSTVDSSCRISPAQDLLPGIPLSDGKYWGIDMDVKDSEIVVSGYHRDVFSGGSLEDVTGIFLLHAENPVSSDDWSLMPSIIHDIEADPAQRDPLSIEFGHEQAHLLYQTIRNDSTGKDRLGVWYSHGDIDQETWTYRKAVGDEAALPRLTVIEEEEVDTLVSIWREGDPQDSELVVFVTDSNFKTLDDMETRIPARGMSGIGTVESERGIQVLFDRVGPNGPQVEYGLIDVEQGWIGLSDSLVRGQFNSMDRSEDSLETMIVVSSSNGWHIRTLIDDGASKRGGSIADQLRSSLGLDQESFEILLIGVALAVLILGIVTLVGLSAQGFRWAGRKRSIDKESSVIMEEDVVELVEKSDLSVGIDVVEIVDAENDVDEGIGGMQGRKARRARRISEDLQDAETEDLQIGALPNEEYMIPVPEMTPSGFQISCPNCQSRVMTEPGVDSAKCPICGSKISL